MLLYHLLYFGNDQLRLMQISYQLQQRLQLCRKKMGLILAMTCELGSILRNIVELRICNACGMVNCASFIVVYLMFSV